MKAQCHFFYNDFCMNLKEKYFTQNNIHKVSKNFPREIEHLRKKHKINLKTKNIALLILDMQRYCNIYGDGPQVVGVRV